MSGKFTQTFVCLNVAIFHLLDKVSSPYIRSIWEWAKKPEDVSLQNDFWNINHLKPSIQHHFFGLENKMLMVQKSG